MNKTEIIEYIKDEIENETDTFHWFDNTPNNPTRKQIEESLNAHQGILDLVQKQQKEIKDLKFKNEVYKKKAKIDENVIDEMAYQLAGLAIWDNQKEEAFVLGDVEEVKQYFYRKAEEDVKNKR